MPYVSSFSREYYKIESPYRLYLNLNQLLTNIAVMS